MYTNQHQFHIPVMGTGHSIDSPIRVAHLGINSVVSVVDDLLCERIRKYYANEYNIPFIGIPRNAPDGRAKRITAFLDTMHQIVSRKFEELQALPLFSNSEKDRYFTLLPDSNPLKQMYLEIADMVDEMKKSERIQELTNMMRPGSIDVNIMAKVDALPVDAHQQPLSAEFSDASSALRGYAQSVVESGLVLSAGFNPRLYGYLSDFKEFYRDTTGDIKKSIILKVSDFRSALIQGKFLAKKGLEITEFRIESGLNCGGHAFASDGQLLPVLLKEFKEKRHQLTQTFQPMIKSYYELMGWEYPELSEDAIQPKITVQGGIGNSGEMKRLLDDFGMDGTGWGSPFLLVPEATCVDDETMQLLAEATENELYLSNVSPLGVPFNNIRNSGSFKYAQEQIEKGKPGSKCPKGFLSTNTEFTDQPICTASMQYQLLKIDQITNSSLSDDEKESGKHQVMEKSCLCAHLGNGSLIRLGIIKPEYGRQEICPGPNIAWFTRKYSMNEMIDHIYGRTASLVPKERPHMFAKELQMYVDYLMEMYRQTNPDSPEMRKVNKMASNLQEGMDYCLELAEKEPYEGENLESLKEMVDKQRLRLHEMFAVTA